MWGFKSPLAHCRRSGFCVERPMLTQSAGTATGSRCRTRPRWAWCSPRRSPALVEAAAGSLTAVGYGLAELQMAGDAVLRRLSPLRVAEAGRVVLVNPGRSPVSEARGP